MATVLTVAICVKPTLENYAKHQDYKNKMAAINCSHFNAVC